MTDSKKTTVTLWHTHRGLMNARFHSSAVQTVVHMKLTIVITGHRGSTYVLRRLKVFVVTNTLDVAPLSHSAEAHSYHTSHPAQLSN